MKKFTFILLAVLSLISFACAQGNQSSRGISGGKASELTQVFENDYFSIKYPDNYMANGSFGCKPADMEELRHMDADAIAAMPMNELYLVPDYSNLHWESPEIYIDLSRQKLAFPIRMFMDLSIHTKQQDSDNLPLIGCSEVDSISFAGMPALEVEFAYRGENGDTLVHHQIIVQTPDYSLYYLNNKYNPTHPESYHLGEKILSSFTLKH